jgi:hypothetical protein
MARFSIIVPGIGSNSRFEETLASVLRYRPDHCQIIVVHQQPYQDPYGLEREVDFIEISAVENSDGVIPMFNAGVQASRGTLIGFLRPGTHVTQNWDALVDRAFEDSEVAAVTPALIASSDMTRLVAAGVQFGAGFARELVGTCQKLNSKKTAALSPLGPTSWAGFYRKSYLASLDDCDVDLDSDFFDLDLALSFAALKFKCVFLPECVVRCDDASDLTESAIRPHGCSAQRAWKRFEGLISAPPAASWSSALLGDLLSWPWRWSRTIHHRQRSQAAAFEAVDGHYRRLLEVLKEQRARLVAPGLHSRVAAQQRFQSVNLRRAA